MRPRAAFELARLRFAEIGAEGAGARLSATQLADILTLLFSARGQAPPLAEVYELIADVWARSASAPTPGHLQVLEEGVRLFPRRTKLIQRAAQVQLQFGFRKEAAAFVDLGLRVATDAAEREVFVQLRRELEAMK